MAARRLTVGRFLVGVPFRSILPTGGAAIRGCVSFTAMRWTRAVTSRYLAAGHSSDLDFYTVRILGVRLSVILQSIAIVLPEDARFS